MSSLNRTMLIGRVGKDVEVRTTDNSKVASFTLATSEKYKDRNGEVKEQTEWHNIVVWGKLADVCEKYVQKGSTLYVEGKIRTRSWDDKDGNKRYITEILASAIQLLDKKENSSAPADTAPQRPQSTPLPPMGDDDDSDLPF